MKRNRLKMKTVPPISGFDHSRYVIGIGLKMVSLPADYN